MMPTPADFEIIDAHTHPFLNYKDGCIGPYGKPENMEEFDREMKKVGIRRYAGAPLVKHPVTDFREIRGLNDDALRIRDRFPDYIPGIQVHGDFPEESIAELNRCYGEGVRYVGELVPYIMQTGKYNSPGMLEILRAAGELHMTANLDGGARETVIPVLENCPGLKVILAHPGEPSAAMSRFDFIAEYENLHLDISGYGLFRWNMLRFGIDRCGVKKLIFGSDMPTCSAGMYLFGVLSENLTEEELRLVLAGNFKRLLEMN